MNLWLRSTKDYKEEEDPPAEAGVDGAAATAPDDEGQPRAAGVGPPASAPVAAS